MNEPSSSSHTYIIDSPWFDRFTIPTEIVEHKKPISVDGAFPLFDLIIVNLSPFSFSLPAIPAYPNTVYAISSVEAPSDVMFNVRSRFLNSEPIFIDPVRAMAAIAALNVDPTSSTNVSIYTRDIIASGISALNRRLDSVLTDPDGISGIRMRVVHSRLRAALRMFRSSIDSSIANQVEVDHMGSLLSNAVAEIDCQSILPEGTVYKSLQKAEAILRRKFDTVLGPWRVITHIDDVGDLIRRFVMHVWCRDLEQKVQLQCLSQKWRSHNISDHLQSGLSASRSESLDRVNA